MRLHEVLGVAVLALAASATTAQQPPEQPKQQKKTEQKIEPKKKGNYRPEQGSLKVGGLAPRFELADADGKNQVKLADLKGKPVVLIFGSCT